MFDILKMKKPSKEERAISRALTISIVIQGITGCILGNTFTDPASLAAVGIMSMVSLFCIVGVWIVTTISLRNL